MIRIKLPHGLRYKLENLNPGVISLESDNEPIITIYGHGVHLQYRLISLVEVKGTYTGGLTEEEKMTIFDELIDKQPKLLAEAKVRHYVRFVHDSPCYYDFHSEMLYGASGVREKKGPINGIPFRPSANVRDFIKELTEVPDAKINVFEILEVNKSKDDSFRSIWLNFHKLDSSIRATFVNIGEGFCVYKGDPPTWQVVEEIRDTDLTLAEIFNAIAYRQIVATFDEASQKFNASLLNEVERENVLTFLGLDSDLFDPSSIEIERFISKNYCDSANTLETFLSRHTDILEGVWNRLKKNIESNLSCSFSASSYYEETSNIPIRESDLEPYSFKIPSVRWNNALERACSAVKKIINSTCVGIDFFMHCETEVNTDSVTGYIAALVLISFYYCKTPASSDEKMVIKAQYRKRLLSFIQEKFDYNPPDDSGDSLYSLKKGLQDLLQDLSAIHEQFLSEGQYAHASEIKKIYDRYNLNHNDENSLLPPPSGRDL